MKSVLISVQPQWCKKITNIIGQKDTKPIYEKSVEIRKTRPKLEFPFKCYIYCTQKPFFFYKSKATGKLILTPMKYKNSILRNNHYEFNGKVIGEFVCDKITEFHPTMDLKELTSIHFQMCDKSCVNMADLYNYANGKMLYGWHISELVIYDEPKELSEFCRHDNTYDNAFGYVFEDRNKQIPLSRPPQSWCYVEETEVLNDPTR